MFTYFDLKSTPKPPKTTPREVPKTVLEMPRAYALKKAGFGTHLGSIFEPKTIKNSMQKSSQTSMPKKR